MLKYIAEKFQNHTPIRTSPKTDFSNIIKNFQ